MNNTTFGDETFGYYETVAGGAGAVSMRVRVRGYEGMGMRVRGYEVCNFQGPGWDGRSGVHTHMTNTRITDPEILERRYIFL